MTAIRRLWWEMRVANVFLTGKAWSVEAAMNGEDDKIGEASGASVVIEILTGKPDGLDMEANARAPYTDAWLTWI